MTFVVVGAEVSGTVAIFNDDVFAWLSPARSRQISGSAMSATSPVTFTPVGAASEEPWLERLREGLGNLRDLGEGWAGPRSKAIDVNLIYRVERLIRDALSGAVAVRLPFVVPSPDGGIQVEWHCDSREFEIYFGPKGSVSALLVDETSGLELEREGAEAIALLSRWAPRLAENARHAANDALQEEAAIFSLAA